MQFIDITNPVFRILKDQSRNDIDRQAKKHFVDGWLPVGTVAQSGREWYQVMIKEEESAAVEPKRPRGNPNWGKKEG